MKRSSLVILLLAIFSVIDGYLLSSISLLGRAGVTMFYTEYQFLKSWWKGALLVFIVWIILYMLQSAFHKRAAKTTSNILQVVLLLLAVGGLLASYADFHNSRIHRWLGMGFHFGVYLFWLGWIAISVWLLVKRKPVDADIASIGTL